MCRAHRAALVVAKVDRLLIAKASCRGSWRLASMCASAISLRSRVLQVDFSCKA